MATDSPDRNLLDAESGKRRNGMTARIAAAVMAAAVVLAPACSPDKKETLDLTIDPETTPTMLTHDVSTLISDSGITRYHITAPIWYVFGESAEPRWTFPEGLFLEKFDDDLNQDATVEADSATYFEKRKLWRLDGNVRIRNIQNEKFLTQQLYWDQRNQKIYSDSFIHIERSDRVIEGMGFTSNDRLSVYEVNRVSGIFPVSQFTGQGGADSTASATPGAPRPRALGQPRSVGGPSAATPAQPAAAPPAQTAAPAPAAADTARRAPHAPGSRRAVDLRARRARRDSLNRVKLQEHPTENSNNN